MLTRMSNLTFRPRPLDVNRPIPIIRKEIEDEAEDAVISRSVPQMPTGMEMEEEAEKHIQEAINQSLKGSEIPTPVVKVVEGYDDDPTAKPFIRPQSYIRVKDKTNDEWDLVVEYDLDDEDEEFLNQLNATKKILPEAKLELLMDRFEKESSKMNEQIPPLSQMETIPGLGVRPNILQTVYNYWAKKRSKSVHSLIIRLIKPPDPDDPNPYRAFRPRNEEKLKRKVRKNDQSSLIKMKQLRHEMEKARTLLEMIKKREKLKRDRIQFVMLIFEAQLIESEQMPEKYQDIDDLYQPRPKKKLRALPKTKKQEILTKEPADIYECTYLSDAEMEESEEDSDVESPSSSPKRSKNESSHISPLPEDIGVPPSIGNINLAPKIPPFRGRARMGRGGRLIFDRKPIAKTNGIVNYLETDEECNPRLNSMLTFYQNPLNPLAVNPTDPEKLLKKLENLIDKKKKYDAQNGNSLEAN